MTFDKAAILALIITQLRADISVCEQAVKMTHDTATHKDTLGSSRHETMGLEASYLAQGQGLRLLEVERSLAYFLQLRLPEDADIVGLSSLIVLCDEQKNQQHLWLAGDAGGLKVEYGETIITVITPKSPLGSALIDKRAGDEFEISIAGSERCYKVYAVQ